MFKLITFIFALLIAGAISQRPHIIYPTYRPPPQRPVIIRTVRSADQGEPQWLYKGDVPRAPATGDHPFLPKYIDDVKIDPNRRYARNIDRQPQWLYRGNVPRAPASSDHPVLPRYIDDIRINPSRRYARSADDQELLWLYEGDIPRAPATGDNPNMENYFDDFKLDPNTRYARSLDSPSAKRGGGSHSTSSSSRNTGPTHPGYNRRNA